MNYPTNPANLVAEEDVLGAMLLSEHAITAAAEILNGEEFHHDSHRAIYLAALGLWRDGEPVDPVTVIARLEREGTLAAAGGSERVTLLAASVTATANTAHKARLVHDAWGKRLLLEMFTAGAEAARNGRLPGELLDRLEDRAVNLRGRIERGKRSTVATTEQLAERLLAEVADPPEFAKGVPGPFRFQSPFEAGCVHILAGYTSHGKSVLGVQHVRAAARAGLRVGVFTLEMTREALFNRMVSCFGVPLAQVKSRRIEPEYQPSFDRAIAEVRAWPVEIIDDAGADSTFFRRQQKLRRYDLLVIDHLHEIQVTGRGDNHRLNLNAELQRIKALAKDLDVAVLLLAQLARQGGQTPFPRPTTKMLKESGKIEEIAETVTFVWRPVDEYGLPGAATELILAKNRDGVQAKAALHFDGPCVRFTEVSQ